MAGALLERGRLTGGELREIVAAPAELLDTLPGAITPGAAEPGR